MFLYCQVNGIHTDQSEVYSLHTLCILFWLNPTYSILLPEILSCGLIVYPLTDQKSPSTVVRSCFRKLLVFSLKYIFYDFGSNLLHRKEGNLYTHTHIWGWMMSSGVSQPDERSCLVVWQLTLQCLLPDVRRVARQRLGGWVMSLTSPLAPLVTNIAAVQ